MRTSAEMTAKRALEDELQLISLMLSGDVLTTLPTEELETVKDYIVKRLDALK